MMRSRTALGLLAATLALATTPALAAAAEEPLIPPGNSAVNQYTESIPTSRGGKDAEQRRKRSPQQVLGSKNTKRLESHGGDGREVAEVAAETAPAPAGQGVEVEADEEDATAGGTGGGNRQGGEAPPRGPRPVAVEAVNVEEPEGSSGLGEVLAGATGSTDSGETGLLLPLLIVLALAGSIAYAFRQRRAVNR